MNQQFNISPDERKRAKWPHEIFLINLIFNHIFVFCATLAVVTSFPIAPAFVPMISFCLIGYLAFQSQKITRSNESWFVKAHWRMAAKRNKLFTILLTVTCVICGGGLMLSKAMGWSKIPTIALIGGAGLLPFMVALLVLIVLGNESVVVAREGKLPQSFFDKNPDFQAIAAQHTAS